MGTKYVLIGNPGVGKSTILNGFVGDVVFENGPSFGGGLTSVMNVQQVGDDVFVDTPGLADVNMRKRAAEEISKAMKLGGKFKIIFILQPNEGRTRPEDITTMTLILESAPITSYGIILNKVEEGIYDQMITNSNGAMDLTLASFNGVTPKSAYFHLMKRQPEIAGKKNCKPRIDPDLAAFIVSIPSIEIEKSQVKAIEFDRFEKMVEALESQLKTMQDDKMALEAQLDKDKQEWQAALKEMEQRNASLKRDMEDSGASSGGVFQDIARFAKDVLTGTKDLIRMIPDVMPLVKAVFQDKK